LWDYLCTMHNQTLALTVDGMTCGHCSRAVKELIEEIEGITEVHVSLETKEAVVTFSDNFVDATEVIQQINSNSNYKASLK
jgi:copper chaperone